MKLDSWLVMVVCLMVSLESCDNRSEYEKLVDSGLQSGETHDSLFLNFYFGISREEFFSRGWEENKKGLIAQGPRNQNIKYIMPNNEPGNSPIHMLFYPDFDAESKIKGMWLTFNYPGWAPWNRKFFSDSLIVAVQDTLMKWYGGANFHKVTNEEEELLVKVDGNRLISLYIEDEQNVKGYMKDLTHKDNVR